MSWIAKCDGCGKTLEAPTGAKGNPYNPYDEEERGRWFSRVPTEGKEKGKCLHSCSRECIEKIGGLVAPW